MQKALALEVARELNISPELCYTVCKSFHDGLRQVMNEPEKCKAGIMIQDFITLRLSVHKIEKSLKSENASHAERKQEVLKNIKKNERKKKQAVG